MTSVAAAPTDWPALTRQAALALWGQPDRERSSRHELRWGRRGSRVFYLETGRWHDYEAGEGGGAIDLIRREIPGANPRQWLADLAGQSWPASRPEHTPAARPDPARHQRAEERITRSQAAAQQAQRIISQAAYDTHPYLAAKGFPDACALTWQDRLIVPMRCRHTGILLSLQSIAADGAKRFLPGGVAKHSIHRLGRYAHSPRWYCEGYATARSIKAALVQAYRPNDEVVICFSASNLAAVARTPGIVIADHDYARCRECDFRFPEAAACPLCDGARISPPAGANAARQTGLPWWQPPHPGADANDFHRQFGLDALAANLIQTLRDATIR